MKKIIIFIMLFITSIGLGVASFGSELPEKVVIHYYRFDETYTNYHAHLWENLPAPQAGTDVPFVEDDTGWAIIEVDLAVKFKTTTKLGIIIKNGTGWEPSITYREPGGDRFIDFMTAPRDANNEIHAYFIQGATGIAYSSFDIVEARFNTQGNINIISIGLAQSYEIYANDVVVASGVPSATNFIVDLDDFDLSKNYKVILYYEDDITSERSVSIDALYDTSQFIDNYSYEGTLGVSFENEFTIFRLWAPLSAHVTLNLYNQGHPGFDDLGAPNAETTPYHTEDLYPIEHGAWEVKLTGDYAFKYYTFSINNNGVIHEVVDPYAYSTGANGARGMIVDFDDTNPNGWVYEQRPDTITQLTDYIVYELHVRDLTSHSTWNGTESYRGKFMGITESGTTYTSGGVTVTTGLDHIKELGVNAVQLLPIFDFGYVDEVEVANNPNYTNQFNWGYMPYHFNTLEGSYATNPFDGRTRINEFKQVVMALHQQDIRVIMDVVYNHTGESNTSNFHQIVPGYYHRLTAGGSFSNGSGTGNETASERPMMRKFMVDSVAFWATEYNLSGFRFDLMELHDIETMNQIQAVLQDIDPTIIVYGEPWMGGTSPLPLDVRAGKANMADLNNIGAFNDYSRDAIKGSVFQSAEKGWIQGNTTDYNYQGLMYGIVGGIDYPGITEMDAWHLNPNQTINYVTAHDNNTLHDKLRLSGVKSTEIEALQIQANAIVLASQGIPFLHAGVEFMRSKPLANGGYDHNSYESPDSVNQLRWDRKAQYVNVFEYYKTLIEIRKMYSHFRLDTSAEILSRVHFLDANAGNKAIAYQIDGLDYEPDIIVIHSQNPSSGLAFVHLETGKSYKILTYTEAADINGIEIVADTVFVPAHTSVILVEVTEESIIINESEVTINKGDVFEPSSNVTIHNPNAEIYYSSYHDVNVSGRYTITVAVVESYGQVKHYYFTLYVRGQRFNVTVDDSEIGG